MAFRFPRSHSDRVARLRAEAAVLAARYGPIPGYERLEELDRVLLKRTVRIEFLAERITELAEEIENLEREAHGVRMGMEALLLDLIERLRTAHGEGWSPVPVLGYRMWSITGGRLTGAVLPWIRPEMTAECLNRVPDDDVPHSHGRCGPPPCGVYATKHPRRLVREGPIQTIDRAIGLVALSGKVVEHTAGYRAARATVVAIAAEWESRLLATDDSLLIGWLFERPVDTVQLLGRRVTDAESALEEQIEFLTACERRMTWTWEDKSA